MLLMKEFYDINYKKYYIQFKIFIHTFIKKKKRTFFFYFFLKKIFNQKVGIENYSHIYNIYELKINLKRRKKVKSYQERISSLANILLSTLYVEN